MIVIRNFNRYNVTIKKGYVDKKTDRWIYILQIERFDDDKKLEETRTYNILGNKSEDVKQQFAYICLMKMWLNNLKFMELEKIFCLFPENYNFKIADPSLVSV